MPYANYLTDLLSALGIKPSAVDDQTQLGYRVLVDCEHSSVYQTIREVRFDHRDKNIVIVCIEP